VQLDRPAAVWVVSACERLQFKSKEWNFPIVGRFPYLGWFDLEGAKAFAADLKKDGWDVDVRGAGAYSTLGWFRDAVLSSMIPEGPEALGALVNVVLHESVHATIYIKGQAYFNESVASYVADRLTEDYLGRAEYAQERQAYLKGEADGASRGKKLFEAYGKLAELYASSKSEVEKLAEKDKILSALKQELGFRREITATHVQFKSYHTGGSDFEALWKACGADSRRFMKAVLKLEDSSFLKTQQENLGPVLLPLAQSGC